MAKTDLTAERLRELLHYDPATGIFTNVLPRQGARPGEEAGGISPLGYRVICIDYCDHRAHRLAFLYMLGRFPANDVDHINGNRADNRFENLREVTRAVNLQNLRGPQKNNRTGFLGVSKIGNRYYASIMVNGKSHPLGGHATAEEASSAYVEAKRKLHEGCTI